MWGAERGGATIVSALLVETPRHVLRSTGHGEVVSPIRQRAERVLGRGEPQALVRLVRCRRGRVEPVTAAVWCCDRGWVAPHLGRYRVLPRGEVLVRPPIRHKERFGGVDVRDAHELHVEAEEDVHHRPVHTAAHTRRS